MRRHFKLTSAHATTYPFPSKVQLKYHSLKSLSNTIKEKAKVQRKQLIFTVFAW